MEVGRNMGAERWSSAYFRQQGLASQNYTLQMSTSLAATNWTALYVTNNPAANSFLLTDPQATNAARYYLVLVGP